MSTKPKFDYHVYSLTEGIGWYWTPWTDDTCKPVHGPYASMFEALDAVTETPNFTGWDRIFLSDRP